MSRPKQHSASSNKADPSMQRTHIPAPKIVFNKTAQNLRDLLDQHSLPRVIICHEGPSTSRDSLKFILDFQQPILAFMKRSITKVSAHSLHLDPEENELVTVGNGILIPEDYPGWFAVMGVPNGVSPQDQTIRHYTTISCLATSGCSKFLIGGTNCIHGFLNDGSGKSTSYKVHPGTVLRRLGIYQSSKPDKATASKKKGKSPARPSLMFLKCCDSSNQEIFFHVHQTGVFYVISDDDRSTPILQMKDILKRFHFPLIVKLIYGRVPTTPCAFTQILLLTDSGMNHTLVASTLLYYRNIQFEIPLGTEIQFYAAQQTDSLLASKAYINALKDCQDKTSIYLKDMKVVFGNSKSDQEEVTSINSKPNHEIAIPIRKSVPKTDKSAFKTTDKSVPKPTDKSAIKTTDKTASKTTDKSVSKPTDKSASKTTDKSASKTIDKSAPKPIDNSVPKPTDKSAPKTTDKSAPKITDKSDFKPTTGTNEDLHAPLHSRPVMRAVAARNEVLDGQIPRSLASVISGTSYLERMSRHVIVDEGSFILSEQPFSSKSQCNKLTRLSPDNIDAPTQLELVTVYDPPSPDKINGKIPINQIQSPSVHKKNANRQGDLKGQTIVYDNFVSSACASSSGLATCQPAHSSGSPHTNNVSNPDESNIYFTSWVEKPKPTMIIIPCKAGQPVSPLKTPVKDETCFDYLPMHTKIPPKIVPKTSPKPCMLHKSKQSSPHIPEAPLKSAGSSCINGSDTLASMSEGDWSSSKGNKYRYDMNGLKVKTGGTPWDGQHNKFGQEFRQPQHSPSNNMSLQSLPKAHGSNNATSPAPSPNLEVNTRKNEYLELVDDEYQNSAELNVYESDNEISVHEYLQPSDDRTDSGVYEYENGYAECSDGNQSVITNNSKDLLKSGGQPNNVPQLPPRQNKNLGPKSGTLGQIVMASSSPFSQDNTQHLILQQLWKDKVTPTVEFAFASLKSVDIINLLARDDGFDDALKALLPNVGLEDLQMLAACLRRIKCSI